MVYFKFHKILFIGYFAYIKSNQGNDSCIQNLPQHHCTKNDISLIQFEEILISSTLDMANLWILNQFMGYN